MNQEQIQAGIDALVQFYTRTIDMKKVYVVIETGGAARFNHTRMVNNDDCNIIPHKGQRIPIRDHHIYEVVDDGKPREDCIETGYANAAHTLMAAKGKKGPDVTLGDVHAAARQLVLEKLDSAKTVFDIGEDDLIDHTLGTSGQHGVEETEDELPDTAVQLILGDEIVSDPFPNPGVAQQSTQFKAYSHLPDVINGDRMLWLRRLTDGENVSDI